MESMYSIGFFVFLLLYCVNAFNQNRNNVLISENLETNDKFSAEISERSLKNSVNNLPRHWPKDIPFDQRFSMGRYPVGFNEGLDYCLMPAKCQPLNYSTCMGVRLPYSMTSLDLVEGITSQEHAQEKLRDWRSLMYIPKCWSVVQPFLCALYMPHCEAGMVQLPSQEMCRVASSHCRILTSYVPWPAWFQCENSTRFPPMCKNDVPLKFNTTGACMEPLVKTELPASYMEGLEGCGVQCDSPMFLPSQRDQIHKMIAWAACLCALLNLFAVLTFIIDWRHSSKYPALVIFYINLCFLIVCTGWLVQFLPGGREDVVCRKDGTLRTGEPSAGENLSCVVVFVMVYYFLMAGIAWFVILTYAWHLSLQALGKIQECMEKKGAYFHMIAWSIPLVLTITTMALGEIDGDSLTGICFVGSTNRLYRGLFLLVPLAAVLIVSAYFMSKGLITLIRLKVDSEEIISARAAAKINETILRMVVFSGLLLLFALITFICHHYEGRNAELWAASFRAFILCKLQVPQRELQEEECRMLHRPSLAMLQLHILALFLTGGLMSSWIWTQTSLLSWQSYLQRLFRRDGEAGGGAQTGGGGGGPRLQKHRLIAQAFAKRKMLTVNGRLSISLDSTHQDPVGLKFELNSVGSGTMRSSWAAALPKFVQRRDALVATTNSNSTHSHQRTNSIDSEISYSVRRVSVESRRHSVDSAVSVKVSEVTQTLVKKVKTPFHKKSHRTRRRTKLQAHEGMSYKLAQYLTSRYLEKNDKEIQRGMCQTRDRTHAAISTPETYYIQGYRSHRRNRRHSKPNSSNESKDIKDLALQNMTKLVMDMPKPYTLPELSRRRAGNAGLEGDPMSLLSLLPADYSRRTSSTGLLSSAAVGGGGAVAVKLSSSRGGRSAGAGRRDSSPSSTSSFPSVQSSSGGGTGGGRPIISALSTTSAAGDIALDILKDINHDKKESALLKDY